ncbi:efflux RND transporter periplasmic adaptor subunit [Rubellicoccus peritrichatus]|uniref:Efflux RND transporter periplasmic adaptor subunit n=1 Tax=Rubellicoccus peritrichatus TaxID=3080537 RepID=A0AAQ3L5F6_9BACT|nr:efflux RND transporter periplasmic adaptor subunit [Puniceicoccus sp. CR14]WOO39764.1 efflux RND transporter periplasmic adaptor subunit [Puniceicoccus sp. CR14]
MKGFLKVSITLAVVAIAIGLGLLVWRDYLIYPWTRDGQVRAYVVGIAARVDGPMIDVAVVDNQWVNRGDLLFEIDPTDFEQRVAAAKAAINSATVAAENLAAEVERRRDLVAQSLISLEEFQTIETQYAEAVAAIAVDEAELELARLNLSYTKVYATVDGYVTNLQVAEGTYVTAGQPLVALVDASSFWVWGYFKETDLSNIKSGDLAEVRFMGHYSEPIEGRVESIGWGIFQEDGSEGQDLLPYVKPTVDWVRLAQRFPVRIKLIDPPENIPLRIGMTASVMVLPKADSQEQSNLQSTPNISSYPKELVDGRGDVVVIPTEPKRIISLAPSTTEIALELGEGENLIAVTEHCVLPEGFKTDLPRLSTYPSLPFEVIVSLQPDLILLADITNASDVIRLRRFGIPALVMNSTGYQGVIEDVGLAADALERHDDGAEVILELAEARAIAQKTHDTNPEWKKPRVVLFLDREGKFAAGPGSFADGLIEVAGGVNIAAGALERWPQLSREFLVEADPEVILISEAGGRGEPLSQSELSTFRDDAVWSNLSAVREGRVYLIDSARLSVPGPGVKDSLLQVAKAIQDNG